MTDDTLRTDGGTTTFTARLRRNIEQMTIGDTGLYVVLLLAVGFYLVPIESELITSIKIRAAVVKTAPFAPPGPSGFTLEKWQAAVEALLHEVDNSMLYVVPATVISAFIGSITVYRLTTPDWEQSYKAPVLTLIIADIFIPYQAMLAPLTRFWSQWTQLTDLLSFVWMPGAPNDYVGIVELVVTRVTYGIPIYTLLFRAYYRTMNEEMIESARLDGVTLRQVYWWIVFPLSRSILAMILIYQFTQVWNDLLFTLVFVSTESSPTAPVVLILTRLGTSPEGQDFALRVAGAFFAVLPTLTVYIFFGDEFTKGVAA